LSRCAPPPRCRANAAAAAAAVPPKRGSGAAAYAAAAARLPPSLHVIHVGDFYPRIVNDKAENYAAPDMTPEARSVLALVINPFGQSLFEELVGDDAGLGEAIHAIANFDIDPSVVVDQVPEVVFFDDLIRDEF
jgi:hypothetical protein